MSKVMRITGALTAAMLAVAPAALAQVPTARDSVKSPWPDAGRIRGTTDTAYINQAIIGNSLEAQLGRIADSRAKDSGVKDFAKRMVSAHNIMLQQWGSVAKKYNVKTQVDFQADQKQTIDRLQGLSGSAFDQAYMDEMIREHNQALSVFQQIASSATAPDVRQLASSQVPTIREHLSLAQQVGSQVGVSTTASNTGVVVPTPAPSPAPGTVDTSFRRPADRANQNARENQNVQNDRNRLRAEDRDFLDEVLQDHQLQIRLADRAEHEAKNDDTRRLAKQIGDDFKKYQDRWENLANRFGMKVSKGMGPKHDQKLKQLEKAKGNPDRVYARIVADHLGSIVPYFEKEGQQVQVAAVRQLAQQELPVIREAMNRARRLEGQAQANVRNDDDKDKDQKAREEKLERERANQENANRDMDRR